MRECARLAFSGGGKLLWWVGQCQPLAAAAASDGAKTTKCGNDAPEPPASAALPSLPTVGSGRQLTPVNVTTYGWVYTW